MRAAGDAVLGGEGFLNDGAPRPESLLSWEDSFSVAPRRYRLQVPGNVRVPRSLLPGDRCGPPRLQVRGGAAGQHQSVGSGDGEVLWPAEDAGAAQCAPTRGVRRSHRGGPPRRGTFASQGTHLLLPRRARAVGPEESAPGD